MTTPCRIEDSTRTPGDFIAVDRAGVEYRRGWAGAMVSTTRCPAACWPRRRARATRERGDKRIGYVLPPLQYLTAPSLQFYADVYGDAAERGARIRPPWRASALTSSGWRLALGSRNHSPPRMFLDVRRRRRAEGAFRELIYGSAAGRRDGAGNHPLAIPRAMSTSACWCWRLRTRRRGHDRRRCWRSRARRGPAPSRPAQRSRSGDDAVADGGAGETVQGDARCARRADDQRAAAS